MVPCSSAIICTSSLPSRNRPSSWVPSSRGEGGAGRRVGQHTPSCRHCHIRRTFRRGDHGRPDEANQLPSFDQRMCAGEQSKGFDLPHTTERGESLPEHQYNRIVALLLLI